MADHDELLAYLDDLLARAEAWHKSDGPPERDLFDAIGLIADLVPSLRNVAAALRAEREARQTAEQLVDSWAFEADCRSDDLQDQINEKLDIEAKLETARAVIEGARDFAHAIEQATDVDRLSSPALEALAGLLTILADDREADGE